MMEEARELAEQLIETHDDIRQYLYDNLDGNYLKAAQRRLQYFEESSFYAKYHLRAIQSIIDLYEEKNET